MQKITYINYIYDVSKVGRTTPYCLPQFQLVDNVMSRRMRKLFLILRYFRVTS